MKSQGVLSLQLHGDKVLLLLCPIHAAAFVMVSHRMIFMFFLDLLFC